MIPLLLLGLVGGGLFAMASMPPGQPSSPPGGPPRNPPPPQGGVIWTGPVPPELGAWAVQIVHDPTNYPMFATETRQLPDGSFVTARVEWHTWTHDHAGNLVKVPAGLRGVTLYHVPPPAGAS